MPYTPTVLHYNGEVVLERDGAVFSSSVDCFVISLWQYGFLNTGFFQVTDNPGGAGNFIQIRPNAQGAIVGELVVGAGKAAGSVLSADYIPIGDTICPCHFLISVKLSTSTIQVYVNDVAVSGTPTWNTPAAITFTGASTVAEWGDITAPLLFFNQGYVSDFWFGRRGSFVDLSITANRRKFINADLTPVDLGTTGQNPFGTSPEIFQTVPSGGVAADWLTNRGTAGGSFAVNQGSLSLDGNPCAPAVDTADLADLWFSPTIEFVDLSVRSNRRLFVSDEGAPISLGAAGALPTGNVPPVFFSRTTGALPDTFATNLGTGGGFVLSGGDMTNASTSPPCSLQVSTTTTPPSKGVGVTGDYRNGNLYSFNMDTLTDAGSQRRWVRSWRAMKDPSSRAMRFDALRVDMETGAHVPVAAKPQVMLRYSDDGGHTWSDPRIMAVGALGQTSWSVRATRLGATGRNSASDRIFELSSSDQFKVAIVGADVDGG